jgi:hypothetical protein
MKHVLSSLLALLLSFFVYAQAQDNRLQISEVQASNQSTFSDEDGNHEDWIELHNVLTETLDLKGWSLTDDATNPRKWIFSGGTLAANGYLVVFASDKNRNFPGSNFHTNFKLTATGDYLALYDPSGKKVQELNPIPRLDTDFSYGLYQGVWVGYSIASPGAENTDNGLYQFPDPVFSVARGLYTKNFDVEITCGVPDAQIYYTMDGSVPSATNGTLYTGSLFVNGNRIFRAIAIADPASGSFLGNSGVTTCTYLFPEKIVQQVNNPLGYPSTWGSYTGISGTATADYGMDPDLIGESAYKDSVIQSFYDLPIVSLVTDKNNFFNQVDDAVTGGIYIYTEPNYDDFTKTLRPWERPVSLEYINANTNEAFQADCGVQLHGGASRWADKSPKHSLRIDFRDDYGIGKLRYPFFGSDGPKEINSFFLRAGFGYTWVHWDNNGRKIAIYSRDEWHKLIQRRMGNFGSHTMYAHLFINGMYWGMYDPIERIEDDFLESWLGGEKEDYQIVKDGSGTKTSWNNMMSKVSQATTPQGYQLLMGRNADRTRNPDLPVLIEMDNFIDYMILNYYSANSDWDSHNWVAFHNPKDSTTGFRFMCWDSEMTLYSTTANNLGTYNSNMPTAIFNQLKTNPLFVRRFADRVQKHCFNNGWLTPTKAAQAWLELITPMERSLYAESARWGDYRRDVHPYSSQGDLYRKDVQFNAQKKVMLENYFPNRTANFVKQLKEASLFPSVEAPTFYVNGEVAGDTLLDVERLSITVPTGTIYYSLNGVDPVDFDDNGVGASNSNALEYSNPITPVEGLHVMARCNNGGTWSALSEKLFGYKIYTGLLDVHSDTQAFLAGVFPSSFRSYSTLRYEVQSAGQVRLDVFNLYGQKVLTLLDEFRDAGSYSMPFDGSRLDAGMYICRFSLTGNQNKQVTFRIVKL